jgi:hypothetical protein
MILPAAATAANSSQQVVLEFLSDALDILLINTNIAPITTSTGEIQGSEGTSGNMASAAAGEPLPAYQLILTKKSRGNYNIFYIQKFTSFLLPLLYQYMKAEVNLAAAERRQSELEVFVVFITYAKVVVHLASHDLLPAPPANGSNSEIYEAMVILLSYLNVSSKAAAEGSSQESDSKAKSTLEKVLFPALAILLKENPTYFYESLHLIVPRLVQVSLASHDLVSSDLVKLTHTTSITSITL